MDCALLLIDYDTEWNNIYQDHMSINSSINFAKLNLVDEHSIQRHAPQWNARSDETIQMNCPSGKLNLWHIKKVRVWRLNKQFLIPLARLALHLWKLKPLCFILNWSSYVFTWMTTSKRRKKINKIIVRNFHWFNCLCCHKSVFAPTSTMHLTFILGLRQDICIKTE